MNNWSDCTLYLCKLFISIAYWRLDSLPSCHVLLLTWVWSLWREDAKIKTRKISSGHVNGGSMKFCTSENFPLYGIQCHHNIVHIFWQFNMYVMHLSMVCPTTPTWSQCGARWRLFLSNFNKSQPLGHFKLCKVPTCSILCRQLAYFLTFAHRVSFKIID